MAKTVDFYFDFGSLASYLAWTQLPKLCADAGAALVWQPMLLGGVFQSTGNRAPISVPLKGSYLFVDMARFAKRYGVPLVMNPHFPINTLQLMRAAVGLQLRGDARKITEPVAVGVHEADRVNLIKDCAAPPFPRH